MKSLTLFETMRTIQDGSVYEYENEHKHRLLISSFEMGWNHAKSSIQAVFNQLQLLMPFDTEKRVKVCVNKQAAWFEVSDLNIKENDAWEKGITVRDIPFERLESHLKYETEVYQSMMPTKKDAWQETLFINKEGYVLEGNISNIFFVFGNTWVTPGVEGILAGITRAKLIQRLQKKGVHVEQRKISKKEALTADHIFVTNSIKGVIPVVKWGGRSFSLCSRLDIL